MNKFIPSFFQRCSLSPDYSYESTINGVISGVLHTKSYCGLYYERLIVAIAILLIVLAIIIFVFKNTENHKTLHLNKYLVLFIWAIFLTISFYMFTAFLGLDMLNNPFSQASSCGTFGYRSDMFCGVESISYLKILIWFSYGLIAVTVSYSILKAKTRILWLIFIGIALVLSLLFLLSGSSVNTISRGSDYRPLID